MTTENFKATPFYDTLIRERVSTGGWTPADLRPPFDLDSVIGRSYEKVWEAQRKARLKKRRAKKGDVRKIRPLP